MLLDGLTILEWADHLVGPFCTRILADLGAEVIKIEKPEGGDALRRQGTMADGASGAGESSLFAYVNAGKRSLTLDPIRPGGAALLRRLAAQATVIVESQSPGLVEQCGVRTANEALVIVSVTPFGQTGPLRDAAWSDLTLLHRSGFAYHQARRVSDPEQQPPVGTADLEAPLASALGAAVATLWGVLFAQTNGRGVHVDHAQLDFYAHLLFQETSDHARGERAFGRLREPFTGAEVAGGLIWNLRCRDGWVMISPREQHQWDRWMAVMGWPDWSHDTALCGDRLARRRNWERLGDLMSEWSRSLPRHELAERAQAAQVACFPVSTPCDILDNLQLAHRRFFDRLLLPSGDIVKMPGLPFEIRCSNGRTMERGRSLVAPQLGEDSDDILRHRLNLSPAEIDNLHRLGVT